ncbi:ERG4/ERG24 ergosterol biosynthesis family protein [Naegleria gruberi]|uniref:7-dehydrocholesterol reductase n=1 Tax=Naegleria gruberi TaxID=5762 RepID=D2W3J1_NAEGR|nr:ERG4/ERG24 ergosterol biosynthesis family protein [Naegleria gruberi]EFC36320.1 ERG4/ERG24 ergosterol biosynthesis family protein [Naegleria gruberi]|eukprot:XP_002669064.1 ERG4/ERG24 ergosterol biosynthesis family protein [Naegleria gruberi strain NEG-M]
MNSQLSPERSLKKDEPKLSWLHTHVAPLFLMLVTPPCAFLYWYTCEHLGGSVIALFNMFGKEGIINSIVSIVQPYILGSKVAWAIIVVFSILQLTLMKVLPGKKFNGPMTPKGNLPVYTDNGLLAYLITIMLFFLCSSTGLNLFPSSILYNHFPYLIGALNIFSLVFCLFLQIKGMYFPSSTDCGSNEGNFIMDYYWGTELHPVVFGFDVKVFTNCRFGMMSWPLLILSFAAKQYEVTGQLSDSMIINLVIQFIYLTKFYMWESGYLCSIDIMHDRAGYYICWGCLVWVPSVYTSTSLYISKYPNNLGPYWTAFILIGGASAVILNYLADIQRQNVRKANGKCLVWGKKPALIEGEIIAENGDKKKFILLICGFWGITRHFHYVMELLGTFFWTVPALFNNFLPYFYLFFLTILLFHRAERDQKRCSKKYGKYWEEYCRRVPYKVIPYVF